MKKLDDQQDQSTLMRSISIHEVCLGKQRYDKAQKQWLKDEASTHDQFSNCLKSMPAKSVVSDIEVEVDELEDLTALYFSYELPAEELRKIHPNAQYRLRTTYETSQSSGENVFAVFINERQLAQIYSNGLQSGESCTHELEFDSTPSDIGTILFKFAKGSVHILSVELFIKPLKSIETNADAVEELLKTPRTSRFSGDVVFQLQAFSNLVIKDENGECDATKDQKFTNDQNTVDNKKKTQKFTSAKTAVFKSGMFKSMHGSKAFDASALTEDEQNLRDIRQQHEDNDLVSNLSTMESLDKYQSLVEFQIPLNELYELESACLHCEGNIFCAVLVRIKHKKILKINKNRPFLLQIWLLGGQIIFEKSLMKPVCNWNMTGDTFLFQEDQKVPEVHLLTLSETRQPKIYKFKLPDSVIDGQTNTYFDEVQNKLVVPKEKIEGEEDELKVGDSEQLIEFIEVVDVMQPDLQIQSSRRLLDGMQNIKDGLLQGTASVSELFKSEAIKRAPDKMIDFTDGFIVLAFRNRLLYFDVSKYLQDEEIKKPQQEEYEITNQDIRFVEVKQDQKIICFPELNNEQSCIVVEDLNTRSLSFLAFKLIDDKEDSDKKRMCLIGLSIKDTEMKKEQKSPLLKFRATASYDEKTEKWSQVGLALREDGSVQVYADFIYADTIYEENHFCVDIEAGNKNFFFKMVRDTQTNQEDEDSDQIEITYKRVSKRWKNRIGPGTIQDETTLDSWDEVIHERVSPFVKLYTDIRTISTYVVVAHRNLLSLYDTGDLDEIGESGNIDRWVDTIQLHIKKDFIRYVTVQKRTIADRITEKGKLNPGNQGFWQNPSHSVNKSKGKESKSKAKKIKKKDSLQGKFEIVCLVGINTLVFTTITAKGRFKRDEQNKSFGQTNELKGRVLKLIDDKTTNMGLTILTDDGPTKHIDFKKLHNALLYNFPLTKGRREKLKLQQIKMREVYDLLDSDESEEVSQLLTPECSFGIQFARRETFQSKKRKNAQKKKHDEFKFAFKKMKTIRSMSIYSNGTTKLYPMVKSRNVGTDKAIDKIYLIKSHKNTRKYEIEETTTKNPTTNEKEETNEIILEEFFATLDDFQDKKGCYIRISHEKIQIFDKEANLFMSYKGFTFRSVIQVRENYLYAACDANFDKIELEDGSGTKLEEFSLAQVDGLYVYNVRSLLESRIEPYRVSQQGMGGCCTLLQYNSNKGRLSFTEDYNTLIVIPMPQFNLINFIGMRNKDWYLIWREKKGYFTALSRKGELCTWSILTGKLLYRLEQDGEASVEALSHYEVYQADPQDITYTRNAYNLEDRSISLLRTKEPMRNYGAEKLVSLKQSISLQDQQMIERQQLGSGQITTFDGMSFDRCTNIFESTKNCKLVDSTLKFDLYHFKVMQLRTFDDSGEINECKISFHFMHRLIRKNKTTDESWIDPEWDFGDDSVQRLYLSRNTMRLMEVINNTFAIVYNRRYVDSKGEILTTEESDNIEDEVADTGQQVKWLVESKITRWPSNLTNSTSVPFIFSQNFTYQLDFDAHKKSLLILLTKTQEIYLELPSDMITTQWAGRQEEIALELIFSRMKWEPDENERMLRIVTQNNLDCIFEIRSHDVKDLDPSQRYLKLLSVCKIDNLHTNNIQLDSPHFFVEPKTLEPGDITPRLIRMNQKYKMAMMHAINMGKYKDENEFKSYMLSHVQNIDYLQPWGDLDSYFAIEMSFTWLDWLIIEQAIGNEKFRMQRVSVEQRLQLAQNIFPNGKGILHMLAIEKNARMRHINKLAFHLFDMSKQEIDPFIVNIDTPVKLEIPFLNDLEQKTALDICLDVQVDKGTNICPETRKIFCSPRVFCREIVTQSKQESGSKNIMLADSILENIMNFGMMHSSHQIIDAIIAGTRLGLPSVKSYLESRILKAEHPLLLLSYPKINESQIRSCPAIEGDYGIITASTWGRVSDVTNNLFKQTGARQPTRFQMIDLPELHQPSQRGREFIEALTECQDLDFFMLKSVQVLIDNHYFYWYYINLYSMVIPAFLQIVIFWFWNNIVLPIRLKTIELETHDNITEMSAEGIPFSFIEQGEGDQFNFGDLNSICKTVLFLVTFYLFCFDFTVLLSDLWFFNTMDSAPSGSVAIVVSLCLHLLLLNSVTSANQETIITVEFWQMQSWVALAVWVRIISTYLGEIQQFSWLIGLIKYSCTSTGYFLTVFICFVTAFADSFNALEYKMLVSVDYKDLLTGTPEEIQNFKHKLLDTSVSANFNKWMDIWQISFRSGIGDFNGEQIDRFDYVDWLIFFLACFFLIILMLNLLISVIAEAQAGYTEARVQSTYKERANQIRRYGNSFFWPFFKKKADSTTMLYIVQQASNREALEDLQADTSTQSYLEQLLEHMKSASDTLDQLAEQNDATGGDNDNQNQGGNLIIPGLAQALRQSQSRGASSLKSYNIGGNKSVGDDQSHYSSDQQ